MMDPHEPVWKNPMTPPASRLLLALLLCAASTALPAAESVTVPAVDAPKDAGGVFRLEVAAAAVPAPSTVLPERIAMSVWGEPWGRLVRNVSVPSLTEFKPANARGAVPTAVIVIPGGGLRWLAIDVEGYDVARALAATGVTALVLKYRLRPTADDDAQFARDVLDTMSAARAKAKSAGGYVSSTDYALDHNPAVADGVSALRYVHEHARELGIEGYRVGVVGFSAGGFITNALVTQADETLRPAFAGQIYAGLAGDGRWPAKTPPMFLAVAQDDFLLPNVLGAYDALVKGGHSGELHVYSAGQHGFGMAKQGFTSDQWFVEFTAWLRSMGFLGVTSSSDR